MEFDLLLVRVVGTGSYLCEVHRALQKWRMICWKQLFYRIKFDGGHGVSEDSGLIPAKHYKNFWWPKLQPRELITLLEAI